MSSTVLAPGATGAGRSSFSTVWSFFVPPSGCTYDHMALAPPCITLRKAMWPHSPSWISAPDGKLRPVRRFSVKNVVLLLSNAFMYMCRYTLRTGTALRLRHVSCSLPSTTCLTGSSVALMR